ncbi:hypothetical protein PPL_01393 [Heterostelium album PN500]|uniref:Uncharacterized protein n=1 Tax=Heterostelium pallidum (strain ATCC 26659 / Pp 5 / PN500) TaxID=670386 RepID=D3AZ53_HETP5|nr:hypothetical protein PPL_01393 [Heterostelium album PN500]EFA85610.1 hypothetical protein PPL_01393 [Heterostelium album PN500]|eukprot:XP_020437717.1 hypothetical protein PPL_01393 [Heterostelium album PN500]
MLTLKVDFNFNIYQKKLLIFQYLALLHINNGDKTLEKRRKLIEDNFKAEGKVCPLCHKKLNHHILIKHVCKMDMASILNSLHSLVVDMMVCVDSHCYTIWSHFSPRMYNTSLIGLDKKSFDDLQKETKLTEEEVYIFLIWLRHCISYSVLSLFFTREKSWISDCVNKGIKVLSEITIKEVIPPDLDSRMRSGETIIDPYGNERYITIIVDARKKYHTFTKLVYVDPKGKILHLGESNYGSIADITLIRRTTKGI